MVDPRLGARVVWSRPAQKKAVRPVVSSYSYSPTPLLISNSHGEEGGRGHPRFSPERAVTASTRWLYISGSRGFACSDGSATTLVSTNGLWSGTMGAPPRRSPPNCHPTTTLRAPHRPTNLLPLTRQPLCWCVPTLGRIRQRLGPLRMFFPGRPSSRTIPPAD